MTTTAATDPGSRIQLAVHRAVRRDTDRLAAVLAGGDEIPVDAVQAYWDVTAAQLHHHHELEDTVIWALLGERLGDRVAPLLARNAEEHEVMASAMDEFDAALGEIATSPAAARQALRRMQGAIETHLAHEEADVLPLGAEAFTMEDIAFFRAEDAKTNTPDAFLPWLLDAAAEDDLTFFTSSMPAPVRARLDSEWMPRRQAAVEGLRLLRSVATTS